MISNLIKYNITWAYFGIAIQSLLVVFFLLFFSFFSSCWDMVSIPTSECVTVLDYTSIPHLLSCPVWTVSVVLMKLGFAMQNVKAHSLFVLFSFFYLCLSLSFPLPPLSLPLRASGYSLLHVTGEDTWKRIQLQIWHLVARMPAVRGKLWQHVHTLSPCSRLSEWHENTLAQTRIWTN